MKTVSLTKSGSVSSWIRRWILSPLLIFCFVLGMSMAVPAPARASDLDGDAGIIAKFIEQIKNGIEQIKWLKDIFDFIDKINSLLNDFLDRINTSIKSIGQTLGAGQQAQVQAAVDTAQVLTDNATKDAITESGAPAVIAGTQPPSDDDAWHHCASISINAKPMSLEDFVNGLAAAIAKGINLRFRGAGKDGLGGQYDYGDRATRQGGNTGGDAVTVHPYDAGTTKAGVEGESGVADYDIDVARWDATPLIVPPMMSDNGAAVAVPTGASSEKLMQQRWVAARNFCFEIAGRRPTPPTGKQLETPEGMRRSANWNHCAAIQSAFVLQCARYVARFSRANKTDSPDIYAATKSLCQVAGGEAYGSLGAMPKIFNGCVWGVSQYEAEYLTLAMCASPKHSTAAAGAGATYPELMTNNDLCALRITTWQARNAAERANFLIAVAGIADMDSCWANSEGSPIRTKSSAAEPANDDNESPSAKKASFRRSGASSRESSSSDLLPQTIAQ